MILKKQQKIEVDEAFSFDAKNKNESVIFIKKCKNVKLYIRHNDIRRDSIQHNDSRLNDIQHNDTQHNDIRRDSIQHNDSRLNDIQHNDT